MSITVRLEGAKELQAGLRAVPATLASETRVAMEASLLLVEGTARTLAPKDTGRLGGSIIHTIAGGGANLTGRVGPSVQYGLVVEKGRGAEKPMPPPQSLAGWARRHGSSGSLFILARAIGRKGIKARPYMEPAYRQNAGKIVQLFERIGAKVVSTIARG
jgi:hypothetical protein